MTESNIVQLKYPIPIPKEGGGFVNIGELTLGRLKAKHLRLLPDNFMDNEGQLAPQDILPILAGLADIPIEAVDEIDMSDLIEVAESLQGFLEQSLETGKK